MSGGDVTDGGGGRGGGGDVELDGMEVGVSKQPTCTSAISSSSDMAESVKRLGSSVMKSWMGSSLRLRGSGMRWEAECKKLQPQMRG